MSNVLVICEFKEGKLKKTSREALAAGAKLAGVTGGSLDAAVFGPGAEAVAAEAGRHGAKRLWIADHESLAQYATESWTAAAKPIVDEVKPAVLLIPGTSSGRDLAPRLAARLGAGVASDVDRLEWVDGKLEARRPVYSGKAFATVRMESPVAIATTRPNAFPAEETGGGAAEVKTVTFAPPATRARLVESKSTAGGELTIAEADIIVSGGRGLKE